MERRIREVRQQDSEKDVASAEWESQRVAAPPQSRYQYVFTVFTPSYNRAHCLHRVYESLQAQTFRNFEWLIVDDGSTDNTQELIEQWQAGADFPIHYIYQENAGKHMAFNRGVQEARGEFFLTLDSDDACVPEALERFKYHWDLIPDELKEKFSAVTALCKDQYGKLVGNSFPFDPTDSDSLEIHYRFKVKGEKWGFQRTDVLRRVPMPEDIKREYIPEGFLWSTIARAYKTRYVNEPLRIYWSEGTSMVHGQDKGRNALGRRLYARKILCTELDWFKWDPLAFFRTAANYSRFSFHLRVGLSQQCKDIEPWFAKFIWVFSLFPGYVVFLRDRFSTLNRNRNVTSANQLQKPALMRYIKILFAQRRPVRFVFSRLLMKCGLSRFFFIKKKDFILRFYPSALSATLWVNPLDRQSDEEFFRRYLRLSDLVIDVGANIGSLSILASILVGEKGRVFAIEPHPKIFRCLLGNLALNRTKNVDAFNVVLGDAEGRIHLSDDKSDDQNCVVREGGIEVPVRPLDGMPVVAQAISLLKIDVEGYEKFVLRGAAKTLEKTQCIYFELWDPHCAKYGYTCSEVLDLLTESGFEIFQILPTGEIHRLRQNEAGRQCENFLALRNTVEFLKRTGLRLDAGTESCEANCWSGFRAGDR